VPTLYTAILKHPKAQGLDLKSLNEICMSGGASAAGRGPAELREADGGHADRGLRPHRDLCRPARSARSTRACAAWASCGVPIAGHSIIEIPRHGKRGERVLPGRARKTFGEVCIIGPQVMKGYWIAAGGVPRMVLFRPSRQQLEGPAHRRHGLPWTTTAGSTWSIAPRYLIYLVGSYKNVYPRMIEEVESTSLPRSTKCVVIRLSPDPYLPGSAQGVRQAEARRLAHLRGKLKSSISRARSANTEMPGSRSRSGRSCPRLPVGKLSRKELKEEERVQGAGTRRHDHGLLDFFHIPLPR